MAEFVFDVDEIHKIEKYYDNTTQKIKTKKNNYINVLNYSMIETYNRLVIRIDLNDFIEFDKFLLNKRIEYLNYGNIDEDHDYDYDEEEINEISTERIWSLVYKLLEQSQIELLDYIISDFIGEKTINRLLIRAAEKTDENTFQYLLKKYNDVIKENKTMVTQMLIVSCRYGMINNVMLIIENFDVEKMEITLALSDAVGCDNIAVVKLLIEHGANINYKINGSLRTAFGKKSLDIANFLLSKGANIYAITDEEIEDCLGDDLVECMEFLFDHREFDSDELNEMFSESGENSIEMVKLFIDNGANVKKYGKKLLTHAEDSGNRELIKYLKKTLKKDNEHKKRHQEDE